jgi:paraquat-inducible protein B
VTAITLSADRDRALVSADLVKSAEDLAVSDTRFWVVRPRVGVGSVSGLETLVSGAYIAVETGDSRTRRGVFLGLEKPPPLVHGPSGKTVILHSELGSANLGAPVYFRRFEVGRVVDRQLEADGRGVRVVAFIDAPNDRFVTKSSRFWNASGINLTLGADGMKLKTEALLSVLAGGIAFETAPAVQESLPAASGTQFTLFKDEASAMAPPDGEPHYVRMRFTQSLRGLSIGAPVEFVGVNVGSVLSIDLDYDATEHTFPVVVTALIYPRRMGRAYDTLLQEGTAESDEKMARLVGQLVTHGLRAQPRTGNLLTGQLYLALDFIPGARKAQFSPGTRPLQIPTVPGSIDELQLRVASIVTKIDRLPLSDIAQHLDSDLRSLHGALEQVDTHVLPATQSVLGAAQHVLAGADRALAEEAPWRENLDQTIAEARRTLRSVRSLTDYLDHHPEALIRGRQRALPPPQAQTTSVGAKP